MKKIKMLFGNQYFQKFMVIIILALIALIYIFLTQQPNKSEKAGTILNTEDIITITGENNNIEIINSQINASQNVFEYQVLNKEDDFEISLDKLFANNKYILNNLIGTPLKHSINKSTAPYYMVDNNYKYADIEDLLLSTYSKEYIDSEILSENNPIYFETDNILYFNENNNFASYNNINFDKYEKEIIEVTDSFIKVKIKLIDHTSNQTKDMEVIISKTDKGLRLNTVLY